MRALIFTTIKVVGYIAVAIIILLYGFAFFAEYLFRYEIQNIDIQFPRLINSVLEIPYNDIKMKESSGNSLAINQYGFIGHYQMGEASLIDVGYYYKESKNYSKNDWKGKWTGKNGINSLDDFLNNPEVQTKAVKEYHKLMWRSYLKDYHKFEGKKINGIVLTKSGMIAAAHLVGHNELKKFIDSDGKDIKRDGNHVYCTEYLSGFQGYRLDY